LLWAVRPVRTSLADTDHLVNRPARRSRRNRGIAAAARQRGPEPRRDIAARPVRACCHRAFPPRAVSLVWADTKDRRCLASGRTRAYPRTPSHALHQIIFALLRSRTLCTAPTPAHARVGRGGGSAPLHRSAAPPLCAMVSRPRFVRPPPPGGHPSLAPGADTRAAVRERTVLTGGSLGLLFPPPRAVHDLHCDASPYA